MLVNVLPDNNKLFFSDKLTVGLGNFPKRILLEAKKTQKESGINSLCIAQEIVELSTKDKTISTPLFLYSAGYSIDKVRKTITFSFDEEAVFFNPFFIHHLKTELNITNFPNPKERIEVQNWLQNLGINLQDSHPQIIGNFHHHRFQILKELEELLFENNFSPNLTSLFGHATTSNFSLKLPKDILLEADTDHQKVFEEVTENNVVIQGPPGTGKSQVLTNLIAKVLSEEKNSIVVSEKRVALEVLVNKLSEFNLDKYCFIASSDNLSHSFLQELKSTWDYLEFYKNIPVNNLYLSEQYLDNLQMTLDILSQKKLIGEVSYHEFISLSKDFEFDQFSFSSKVPEINHFLENETLINRVYDLQISSSLGRLKKTAFKHDKIRDFDLKIARWISLVSDVENQFQFTTWSDFDTLKKDAVICQVFENDYYKKYRSIFKPNSSSQKKFLSLRKKSLKAKSILDKRATNSSQWKVNLSETETKSLLKQITSNSFFAKIKWKKRWKEISTLPYSEAEYELTEKLIQIKENNDYSEITVKFCEIGIESVDLEVEAIYQTLHAYSENDWIKITQFSQEKKSLLINSHRAIEELHRELKDAFHYQNSDNVLSILRQTQEDLGKIIPLLDELKKLDETVFNSFSRNETIDQFKGQLFTSHWVNFQAKFPAFSQFKIEQLKSKISDVIIAQKTESKLFAKSIENRIHKTFVEYHELLSTPARKLNKEQKEKKVRLRRGKAILIKEFSKTRSHPSLRELQNSEAREWIQLLKPIWLSNPTQVGKCFPLEMGVFDLAIFDEASQIPLQNAMGTIQRSRRIIVAGDEHQMGPTNYFSKGSSEQIDLLHQANYYWDKIDLKHHYRSLHPDLIAFSNQHFYKNELKAFPAFNARKPLHHYFVDNGQFIDRKNEKEAIAIAEKISSELSKNKSLGVVAFSEEQLSCIWNQLKTKDQEVLSKKVDNNQAFFKSLENVQGDECDLLFISFGYAKNEDGDFHMRFGPMNTLNGRKRLNVLLTRSRQELHFFCSIKASDFKLRENESINLLKKWIAFSEQGSGLGGVRFPFDLQPEAEDEQLTFHAIQEKLPSAIELTTLQKVLESRGWRVSYS